MADLKGADRVMCSALERLLPLSLHSPHDWEEGESPTCLRYVLYFALAYPRGMWGGWRQRAWLGATRNPPLLPHHL